MITHTHPRQLDRTKSNGLACFLKGILPPVHQDPFDRLLVAQAKADGLVLVTHDSFLPPYGPFVMLA